MMKALLLLFAAAAADSDITTSDSLALTSGAYSTILFTASSPAPSDAPPATIAFETSGDVPPGMIFEPYACNKPDMIACPAIARADGIYLDGVPTQSGSFEITIKATYDQQSEIIRHFTVVVKGQ